MAQGKDVRVTIILECISCIQKDINKEKASTGISRYTTKKNQHNMPNRVELRKFCPYCYIHTNHTEIKK